jgi:hypothetical protein
MESIKDLLASKNLDEPTEIAALREYCQNLFNFLPEISTKNDCIWLKVPNGIIASELRMRITDIQMRCGLTQKLVIRIAY